MFGPLNVFRSLPEASSTHSATAQQSPQGSSMKGLCAVVGIGTTAVLHSVLKNPSPREKVRNVSFCLELLMMPPIPNPICHSSYIQVLSFREVGLKTS